MSSELSERIDTLEIRLAHQEAALEELTAALLKQESRVREQERTIEQLQTQLRALAVSPVASRDEESAPPHY